MLLHGHPDMMLLANAATTNAIVVSIMSWWSCKSMGEPTEFLNIHIEQQRIINAHQQSHINACVVEYNVTHEYPALISLPPLVQITADGPDMGEILAEDNLHGSLVGSVMDPSVYTRPEMPFAIGVMERHPEIRIGVQL